MTILTFSLAILITSLFAGIIGSLSGMGGGILLTPVLVLLFNIDMHYAMGASLISVIAMSSSTAVAYLRDGYTNLRIGIFLETAAIIGATCGSLLVAYVDKNILGVLLGLLLLYSATMSVFSKRSHDESNVLPASNLANKLHLDSDYPNKGKKQSYNVQHPIPAWFTMTIAGLSSGLLGIGGGALKVLVMDVIMKLPYKVATTTSNFIMGITASVST